MADETISTRIVANADFSALIADVHKVTASLSKLQEQLANSNKMLANQIAVMNRSFSDTLRSTGQFSTHFVSLQSDVEKFGKNLDSGKLKLNQYFNTFRDHARTSGGLVRDLAKQQVALQNAILQPLGRNAQGLMQFNVHVPRGLDEVKNKTAIARQELQIMNRVIQDGAGQLINWGKNTQWAGRQLTVGLTVPLAAFGAQAAKAFREADQELVRLTKVYGDVAGSSAAELGKVRDDVVQTSKEISAAMGVSFKETIGLAADIAATGKTGDELLGSIKETTRLSVLGEVDRQEAMKATLAIQSAFKQNTDELSQSINFLNAVENQTSTTLNDLVEAIPKAGPVIQGLGGSVQDLALYMTAMREGGINASEGANALKSALASLINPTDVAVGKFKTLGIDLLGIVNNNAGNLTGTLMALQGALDSLDPLQKQQAIEQLFGKFQFSRLNALFENLGRQGSQTLQVLDLMKASSTELADVAGRELTAVTESASGKYRRALESLKASLAEVGEQFLTINTTLIQVIDKVVQFATNLPKPVKQILALLGGVTAIAGPLIMITGVLANFFGYMAKGVFHLKAFFKGGEGWKYLTPEMLAAEKAGKLVEQSFYSDAKAAAVLKQALGNLIDEFSVLEAKAKSGAMSVNPAVSTMAGNLVMAAGGQRVVNPQHPLAGPMGTRASSHMVPRAGMSDQEKLSQTMFGMVPGSGMVNQKIGQNPQIYMNDALPNVPGLTSIGGVSTGVVAGEAARWHSMMATLSMQSKAEIEALKKQIVATGVVSKDFMMQFDDILPVVSKLTDNAARESAVIVAELRAGKMTVEAAKAKIIALNLETERMIASAVGTQASAMGRTINPTMVPTLNQPVVDATGKSNMRELFKKGKTKDFINKIAGALGVRTSGAGYNIETTMPRKMNSGGYVYTMNDGNIVPGPNVNADVVPAMLTPGEFVVNAESTRQNLPLLQAINGSGGNGPGYNDGSRGPVSGGYEVRTSGLSGEEVAKVIPGFKGDPNRVYTLKGTSGLYIGDVTDPAIVNEYGSAAEKKAGKISRQSLNLKMKNGKIPGKILAAAIKASGSANRGSTEQFLMSLAKNGIISASEAKQTSNLIYDRYIQRISSAGIMVGDANNDYHTLANRTIQQSLSSNPEVKHLWDQFSQNIGAHTGDTTSKAGKSGASTSALAQTLTTTDGKKIKVGTLEGSKGVTFAHAKAPEPFLARLGRAGLGAFKLGSMLPRGRFTPGAYRGFNRRNAGGMINGYNRGGIVQGYNEGGEAKSRGTGGMGMFMGGMGLQMGAGMVGGTAGSIMSNVGMAMQFMPMLGMLPKLTTGTKIFSVAIRGLVNGAKAAAVALRAFAVANPLLLAGTVAVAGLIAGIKAYRKELEETRREETNSFGITDKGAKELGIKYVSLTDRVKALKEEQKLLSDQARSAYENYQSSGVSGLNLTIKQLKELKERVKTDMPEILATFNSIDSSKVNDLASNLKAQMIASGKSVEEATNLIYALIESSDKAGQGVRAITDSIFTKITDQGSAASFIMKNFAKSVDDIYSIDPGAFASNVDTVISSLDSAVKSLVGTKNATGETIDEAMAISIQMKNIADSGVKNKQLGAQALAVLKQQRPEFAYILNSADTIGGMYAKWRLMLANVRIDLSNISSEQAELLAKFTQGLNDAADAALTSTDTANNLSETATVLDDLAKKQAAAAKAAKNAAEGNAGLSKKAIKAIQDEIKAIRERAEAKKRALRETFDKENAELELQQAKLDLQSAVARGDNEAAASAQIRIQQIQKEASLKAAEARIDENARKAEAIQQKKLDDDAALKDAQGTTATKKGTDAANLGSQMTTIKNLGNRLGDIGVLRAEAEAMMKVDKKAGDAMMEEVKNNFFVWLKDLGSAAKDSAYVRKAFEDYLTKDSKGNITSQTKAGNTAFNLRRGGGSIGEGGAWTELGQLSAQFTTFALDITGGKKLSDIYEILKTGTTGKPGQKNIAVEAKDLNALMTKLGKPNAQKFKTTGAGKGDLEDQIRRDIIMQYGLKENDTFDFLGVKYRVTGSGVLDSGASRVTPRKAMGGYVTRASNGVSGMTGSQPYLVGERGPELFVPSSGGQIIPNNILGPKYDIPGNTISGVKGGANNSYNNNVYNIDIDLNGTNVSVNDIMKAMKAEMALIGAKEGRVRTFGGNY
jgi:TP901 family phage tail tape measure protein